MNKGPLILRHPYVDKMTINSDTKYRGWDDYKLGYHSRRPSRVLFALLYRVRSRKACKAFTVTVSVDLHAFQLARMLYIADSKPSVHGWLVLLAGYGHTHMRAHTHTQTSPTAGLRQAAPCSFAPANRNGHVAKARLICFGR